jgi:hypothetical protein
MFDDAKDSSPRNMERATERWDRVLNGISDGFEGPASCWRETTRTVRIVEISEEPSTKRWIFSRTTSST